MMHGVDAVPHPAGHSTAPPDPEGDAAESASRHDEVRDAATRAMATARALQGRLRRMAASYPTAEERAVSLVELTLRELNASVVVAWRLIDEESALEVTGATPLATEVVARYSRIALAAACPVSEAARTERVLHFGSRASLVERYPALRPTVDALGVQALAAVPARYMGRVHGMLLVGWTEPRRLVPSEQVMLRAAAGRLARALAQARLYYGERAAHAAAERARAAEAEARREAERARADAEESRRLAEDANRAKDDFLAVVSHELRTPLQAILGFSDLLGAEIAGPLAPRQHEYVRRVQTAGGHLLDTIENLLGFARAQSGKEVVVPAPFDAAATVAQVLDITAPLAARKQLALAQEGPAAGVDVVSDERKVRQIVTNLVGNAVKFTDHGRVVVETCVADSPAGEWLRITVRDTGIGIPPEQLARVFEPFVQVSGGASLQPTTRPAAGTGLGLSIVRQLTWLLGGDVSVTSTLGEGSTFVVDLPRVYDGAPRRGAAGA